jgi:small-conductance mechanosensitive channel/CRP-like cAMP-binding protein
VLLYPAYYIDDLLRELGAGAAAQASIFFRYGVGIGIWLAGAWLLNELIHVLIWDRLFQRAMPGRPVPGLLKHIVSVTILLLSITGIVGFVFRQSVSGIWATSGVLSLVIGFAARSLIADLFSGIALHLDPPFKIGDWIEWKDGNEEVLARVEQINWRSTRVHARDETKTIFIPNSTLSTVSVVNVFAPQGRTRQIIRVPLDPAVNLERATRVMLAAALTADGPLADPPPDVLVDAVGSDGITFHVRYWHDPVASVSKVRHSVLYAVLQGLDHANIPIARNRLELLSGPLPAAIQETKDTLWNLRRIEIFQAFSESELATIAAGASRHEFESETNIVRQGEPGDSLYFILEGLLDVVIEQEGHEPLRVSRLSQGQYFGEMSLLTGDPRSATIRTATSAVIYEIQKEVLEPILHARPELAGALAATVARRQLENQARLSENRQAHSETEQKTFAAQLLGRIRNFFSASAEAVR